MYIFVSGEGNHNDSSGKLNVQISANLSSLINEYGREKLEFLGNLLLRCEGSTVLVLRAIDPPPGCNKKRWAWVDYSPKTEEDLRCNLKDNQKQQPPPPPKNEKPWYFN